MVLTCTFALAGDTVTMIVGGCKMVTLAVAEMLGSALGIAVMMTGLAAGTTAGAS